MTGRALYGNRLMCGDDVIGYVTIHSNDNFFILGSFRPGPDYELYRQRFDALATLLKREDELSERDDVDPVEEERLSDTRIHAFNDLNSLRLSLESSTSGQSSSIRSFSITEDREVEFKLDLSPRGEGKGLTQMNRKMRQGIAEETVKILDEGAYESHTGRKINIRDSLNESIDGSRLFGPSATNTVESEERLSGCPISVTQETTLQAAYRLVSNDPDTPVIALNFASAIHPGGGFLSGSQAQEESLARASGLYKTLQKHPTFYQRDFSSERGFFSDHMIYSPKVPVIRDDDGQLLDRPYVVSFLTSPAVNARMVRDRAPDREHEIETTMRARLVTMMRHFHSLNYSRLVLGAWGCGVFGNEAAMIAELFAEALQSPTGGSDFDEIVFAILDNTEDKSVFECFRQTLQRDATG